MPSATLTSKGQITIPKKIRDELNLKAGDVLNFDIQHGRIVSMSPNKRNIDGAFGMLYRENQEALTVEEMDAGVAEYFRKKYKKK
jgi:antitoxin PrlF